MKRGVLFLSLAAALTLSAQTVRIVQTNSTDTKADVIDPATNKVVLSIPDLDRAHGVAFSADGHRAYFTLEGNETVVSVDLLTGKTLKSVKLTGHPNNIEASNDGKYVFVAIAVAPGSMDIIDTASMTIVKTMPISGAVHNTHVTPDGKYAIAASVAGNSITAIDIAKLEKVWEMKFDLGVRPIAFERAPDGSTSRMFVQLSNFHGFALVDFRTQKEISRVTLPDSVPKTGTAKALSPSHGIALTPDQKTLIVDSSLAEGVFFYNVADMKYLGFLATGKWPDWLAVTPDGKTVYVANSGTNNVTAVDIANRKEIAKIPVGKDPKRNATVIIR
jgi:YVTN family beta-propeller protein